MVKRGPIFLAGVDRSGLDLLCELLESHPNIVMTRRTNFWSFYLNRFGDLRRPENFERCLVQMMSFRRMQVLQPDPKGLRHEFAQGEATYARLFALLQEHHATQAGKSRWGDKSLGSESYADTIFASYPAARMIHVIRDPRDRCASLIDHRGMQRDRAVSSGTAMWLWSARLARRNLGKYPERYKIVRYETLVVDPEATLRHITRFLGEDYSSAMLTKITSDNTSSTRRATASRQPLGSENGSSRRTIWTTSVGKHFNVLSKREVAFIQMWAHKEMANCNYQCEPIHLSSIHKLLFYLVESPTNLARMAGWWTLHLMHNLRGRTSSANKTGHSIWIAKSPTTVPKKDLPATHNV